MEPFFFLSVCSQNVVVLLENWQGLSPLLLAAIQIKLLYSKTQWFMREKKVESFGERAY